MQEKDIRKQLNQELEKMAPDILNNILAQPIEPVKNEKELMGKDKPLFHEKKKVAKYIAAPALLIVAACLAVVILFIQPSMQTKNSDGKMNVAFSITVDVNPSIKIDVRKDGSVKKITALNKSGKKIVKKVNQKIEKDTDYNQAVKLVVKNLNKNGYLKTKKNAMLLSVVSDDKEAGKEKLRELKANTKNYQKKQEIKCTTVYQNCVRSDKIVKVASKNHVSIGKAALCIELAKEEKASVKKMCKKNIDTLVKKVEESKSYIVDEIDFGNEILFTEETSGLENESISFEAESMEETTFAEESGTGNLENETHNGIEGEMIEPVTEQPTMREGS